MSEPTAQELRIAAKVIRHCVNESSKAAKSFPFWKRIFINDDGDEMLRKSAVLESMADRKEIPNE